MARGPQARYPHEFKIQARQHDDRREGRRGGNGAQAIDFTKDIGQLGCTISSKQYDILLKAQCGWPRNGTYPFKERNCAVTHGARHSKKAAAYFAKESL